MSWCLALLDKKFNKKTINQKFTALEKFARKSYPKDACISLEWLGKVVRKIDKLWYDDKLTKSLQATYGGLNLQIDVKDPRVAGYVLETDQGRAIGLHINRDLFASLFSSSAPGAGYHSGGLLCKDTLICFLHVLLHETVHLVLTLCDRIGLRRDVRHHGKVFNQIIKNLFGQTDSQHGLLKGYNQYHSLDDLHRLVKVDSAVEVWIHGVWKAGKVEKKGTKFAVVNCGRNTRYKVNMGLLRIPP